MSDQPECGILAGQPEILGERCADGGKCHHGCTDTCFRRECCVPLRLSGLDDSWRPPAQPATMQPVDPAKVMRADYLRARFLGDFMRGAVTVSTGLQDREFIPPECSGCGCELAAIGPTVCTECLGERAVEKFKTGIHEVSAHPGGLFWPGEMPEDWGSMPLAKFAWAGDSGDPGVGIPAWYGWGLEADQSGTILGEIFNAEHQERVREVLARHGGCNVDTVMEALAGAGFIVVPAKLP